MKARILTIGLVAAGLGIVPAAAHATSSSSSTGTGATTATTVKPATPATPATPAKTTTTTPAKTTPATPATPAKTTPAKTTTGHYEAVAGTFATQAKADKRLAAITAAGITGFEVKEIGKKNQRYRVEERHLTKSEAKAAVKSLHKAKFAGSFFKA